MSTLTPRQAGRLYNRIGRVQGWQAVFEDRAVRDLIKKAGTSSANVVFELGCGTCRLARHLLARRRLEPWLQRATAMLVGGSLLLPGLDNSVDRFLLVFVFDLLGDD